MHRLKQLHIPNIFMPEELKYKSIGKKLIAEVYKLGKRYVYETFLIEMVPSFYKKMLSRGCDKCNVSDVLKITEFTVLGDNKLYRSVLELKFGKISTVTLNNYIDILGTLITVEREDLDSPYHNIIEITNYITKVHNFIYDYVDSFENTEKDNIVVSQANYLLVTSKLALLSDIIDRLSELLKELLDSINSKHLLILDKEQESLVSNMIDLVKLLK